MELGIEKSFISSLRITPVSGTMTVDPKSRLIVVVKEIAMPDASAATISLVPLELSDERPAGL